MLYDNTSTYLRTFLEISLQQSGEMIQNHKHANHKHANANTLYFTFKV